MRKIFQRSCNVFVQSRLQTKKLFREKDSWLFKNLCKFMRRRESVAAGRKMTTITLKIKYSFLRCFITMCLPFIFHSNEGKTFQPILVFKTNCLNTFVNLRRCFSNLAIPFQRTLYVRKCFFTRRWNTFASRREKNRGTLSAYRRTVNNGSNRVAERSLY